nr:uncharacterized protein LOC104099181 [Nicotiana tomentosiformis]
MEFRFILYWTDGQAERTIWMLEDKLQAYVLDLKGSWEDHLPLIEFSYNNSYHANIHMSPYEALYGRKCRSPIGWFEVGETKFVGPNLVQQAIGKKSYSDNRHRDLEFAFGDGVNLKVSPMKVHPVFHVSMIRKCLGDPSCITPIEDVQVLENIPYEERLVAILDRQVRKLRTKEEALVKVLWRNNNVEEITWKAEEEIKFKYPCLFYNAEANIETTVAGTIQDTTEER